ncbi:hypothetical protein [Mucilaginibacter gilvus]|uniref:Outer membrane protein beta-barrel domain-containing protein n=1 Tax=Mucilaginibacter gilvus TaxID=2305909 RepID=A0A444MTB5_9SPHI|nr:hypothetical protein [Mucilaginibacter gilvus]RWY55850.1 hypothetical protein EPL05_05625 [Mucilaginibacter gilvus]
MKPFNFTLIVFLLFSITVSAQSNYKPGYIINAQNDTVKGFVDYKEWGRNPKQVLFKTTTANLPQKITTSVANGFGVDGLEYYNRAVVKVSTSPVEIAKLSRGIDTTYITDTVFLKVIVSGNKLTFYKLTTDIKPVFYISDKQAKEITALNQYIYLSSESGELIKANPYTNQLLSLAETLQPDNKNLYASIDQTKYDEGELTRIIVKLNGSVSQQTVINNLGSRFFIGVVGLSNKLKFSGASGPFSDGKSATSFSPAVSAGIDFFTNKNTRAMIVRLEGMVSITSYKIGEPQGGSTPARSLNFKQLSASIIPQILYNFYSTEKLKVFANAGIGVNYYHYNKYFYTISDADFINSKEGFPEFENFQVIIPLSVGVEFNERVQIYSGYIIPTTLTNYISWGAKITAIQAGVRYLFK